MSEASQITDLGNSPDSSGPTWADQTLFVAPFRRRRHNLPVDLTHFVGRDRELAEVKRLLSSTRLLTLAGPGGVGKTRLALKLAAEVVDQYPDGVWLVELASLADGVLVSKAVALAVGVFEQTGRTLDAWLVDALGSKHMLLVLDNCEHLLQACTTLAETLLRACPHLRILATSRQSLHVPGEIAWRVPPMAVPCSDEEPTKDTLARYDATRLFAERAVTAIPGLVISAPAAATIAHICACLDGMPLAIELAAARLSVLSLSQIDQRLHDRFRLLTTGNGTALARQQTLRATVDWSFDLLSEREQALFRRLAVFAGGWTLEAAEAVGADERIPSEDILDLLAGLVDKSLVLVDHQSVVTRYSLLETLRDYAREKLRAAGEEEVTVRRHRDFYVDLVRHAEPMLHTHEQAAWFRMLDREHDNLRAVLTSCQGRTDWHSSLVELASRLGWFWFQRGHLAEGAKWLRSALSATDDLAARVDLLLGAGMLAYGEANLEQAESLFAESLDLARAIGDAPRIGRSLACLSMARCDQGDLDRSAEMLEEALSLYREAEPIDLASGTAFIFYLQGRIVVRRGDVERATDLFDESLRGFRRLGNLYGMTLCLQELGNVALDRGDNQRASSLFAEVLAVTRELGNPRGICCALQGQATVARRRGELEHARALCRELLERRCRMGGLAFLARSLEELAAIAGARQELERAIHLLGAASALRDKSQMPITRRDRQDLDYGHLIAVGQAGLGKDSFAAAWATGQTMSLEAILAYALDDPRPASSTEPSAAAPPKPTTANVLSARERDVAVLVAQGFSNRAIADELVIAPRTVDSHVSNILGKLNLHSRAQIAAWCVAHRLVTA